VGYASSIITGAFYILMYQTGSNKIKIQMKNTWIYYADCYGEYLGLSL